MSVSRLHRPRPAAPGTLALGAGLVAAALAIAPPALAQAAGDAAAGQKVTQFLCKNCHEVTGREDAKGPPGGAPTFFQIANAPANTAKRLHEFLGLPHGRMTNVLLTGKEIDNAVAYILTFKRK